MFKPHKLKTTGAPTAPPPPCSADTPGTGVNREEERWLQPLFLGRQPIFDRALTVQGYELLFRASDTDRAEFADGDTATADTIANALLEFGLEHVVGDRRAFINVTRAFLTGANVLPSLGARLVLEVAEHQMADQEIIAAIARRAEEGYTIALDGFVFEERRLPFLAHAQVVKTNVREFTRNDLLREVSRLRAHANGARLVAVNVETDEEFKYCRSLGFDLFQGYFLGRPGVISGRRLPADRISIMKLLARLQDPDLQIQELETIIEQDVALSFRVLTYVSSAYVGLGRVIESVRHAVRLIGIERIRTWAAMFALCRLDDKPPELVRIALARAKTCEFLGYALRQGKPEQLFTAGLFSTLDALLDRPLREILASLALEKGLAGALLEKTGPIGEILACVLAWERADRDEATRVGLDKGAIGNAHYEAILWLERHSHLFAGIHPPRRQ
ncbi:MAG: Cyclic di-GMP phosphodiesterase CdgJ [Gammaproteobacteria bacterium]|nr:Cyclic di-GMP phosphodiesterase CdgJ [Gammaproteobacteria bacterium]